MDLKLYYYSSESNFGDVINPFILEKIFKHRAIAVKAGEADLFMIGSILHKAAVPRGKIFKRLRGAFQKPLYIWSSGFIREDISDLRLSRKLNVCAVRGNLSRKLLEKMMGKTLDVPVGDGRLLISRLLPKMPEKKYAVGIIPHFVDEKLPEIELLHKKIANSVIISPLGDPVECARSIAECETVISSSLHGLIAADSFGIPNRQMVLSRNIVGGLFKYNDYYSAFGEKAEPLLIDELFDREISADTIGSAYKIPRDKVLAIQEKLIDSFPFGA